MLDQLAESDRKFRDTLVGDLASCLTRDEQHGLMPRVIKSAVHLQRACASAPFFGTALQRRSSRAVGALPGLGVPSQTPNIDLLTMLRSRDLAFCHLTANAETLDFSYPGGHLYIHRGAQEALVFMINAREFRLRDVPGELADDARTALAERLLGIGYLEIIPSDIARFLP